jgi:hypothetical protein
VDVSARHCNQRIAADASQRPLGRQGLTVTDFCKLNGWAIQAHFPDSNHANEPIGSMGRAQSTTLHSSVLANKRVWTLTTIPLELADAEALEGLLRGDGWHFDFESDLYACVKDLAPNTGYAGTTISTVQAKLGTKSCKVTSGSTGPTYNCGLTGDWSVMFWQYVAAWAHYAVVYDADTTTYVEYVAGAVSSAINDTYRAALVTGGSVVLKGNKATDNAASDVYIDDLVVKPYKFVAAQVAAHYAAGAGLEFSDMPRLNLSGNIIKSSTPVAVIAKGDFKAQHNGMMVGGVWNEQVRSVNFQLIEV